MPHTKRCEVRVEEGRLILRLVNDLTSLEKGQHALRDFLSTAGTSARAVYQAELVFEELVTNVLRHAYAGRAPSLHAIDIVVSVEHEEIILVVADDGPPFNPVQMPMPPLPESLEGARIGGLGLRFIRAAAKRIEYERIADMNRVTVCVDRR
jgi:serine/threonine-protein kinase RsbW